MNKQDIASKIYSASHVTGEFLLRSGQMSNEYFDKYMFEADPGLLREIAKSMVSLIPDNTDVIAGLEMGGIPIVTALSLESGLPAAFVRKKAKEYGTCKLAEGCSVLDKHVCIIEDVVTTGGQIIESARELRYQGAIIDTVLCVILRNNTAIDILLKEALLLKPLFLMDYIKAVSENVE